MNDKQRHEILIENGWETIEGYAMEYEPPECNNVIISLKEVRRWIGKKADIFYFPKDDYEFARDLESAWDCFLDDYSIQNDLNLETNELEEHILQNSKANIKGDL